MKEILPKMIFASPVCNEQKNAIMKNNRAVDALWSLGISGDKPIILFTMKNNSETDFLKRLLKIHRALLNAFIKNDLVIVYSDSLKNEVEKVIAESGNSSTGIFALNENNISEETVIALTAFCNYLAKAEDTTNKNENEFKRIKILEGEKSEKENSVTQNGYEINRSPVLPWCFVYSNNSFGTLVSDQCLGFTFALNSYLNKLTKWTNDTRTDLNSEIVLIKSNDRYFNPTVNANVFFGVDKAVYKSVCDGIEVTVTLSVEKDKMQKNINVIMKNPTEENKTVSVVYSVEPIMYFNSDRQKLLHFKKGKNEISVSNPLNRDFGGAMKLSADFDADKYIFSKTDLFSGKWGNYYPSANEYPVAALGKTIKLDSGTESAFSFYLGYDSEVQYETVECDNRILINSPDRNLNALVNAFLPVQILRGRIQARTGFYQCSGAYGFRDQLQDAMSLSVINPKILKKQICINAAAQFTEGDVLHWFHLMPDGSFKGVRTRYADDRLWLVLAVCEYVNVTGDRDFLNEKLPFLVFNELNENESERYIETRPSAVSETVFEHCKRAVEKSLFFGKNGLPKIFGGDWNDGFNAIGKNGLGESVWLGQFLVIVLERFSALCDNETKEKYDNLAKQIRKAIDGNGWNGEWYIRAFLDDGTPIGDGKNECKIDSLTQSFSVFCNMPDRQRVDSALKNAEKYLVDRENGLIKLFSDGFRDDRRAGYISAYPVGLRENAGQYTHAAVWLAAAFIENGQVDKGYELLSILNPLNKYENGKMSDRYMTEPYFLAGDVYSKKGVEGRGGWSIYTGSAGWYYKTVIEKVFGINKEGNRIFINPSLPSDWDKCSLTLKIDSVKYEISYIKSDRLSLIIDGVEMPYLELDKREHKIIVNFSGK